MKRTFIPLAACALLFVSGTAAAARLLSVDLQFDIAAAGGSAVTPAAKPNDGSLSGQAARLLAGASTIAMEKQRQRDLRRVVLEDSQFSRAGGKVHAAGIFWDGKGPREIDMFIDAWSAEGLVVASYPFRLRTSGTRQRIEATGFDRPDFVQFSFRFASGGAPLEISPVPDNELAISPVSPDAMLFQSDYGELRRQLEDAGYLEGGSFEPSALLGPVQRFRRDQGLNGPGFVTLFDLFALRAFNGNGDGETDLLPYVDWASSLGGGRAIERPTYQPVVYEDVEAYYLESD